MAKFKLGSSIILVVLITLSVVGACQAFVFTDPTGLYSTTIWDQWVYQAHHSTAQITVFYGEGNYDLLYFESLGTVADDSVDLLAERSIELYGDPGGLESFQLETPLKTMDVAGQSGLSCVYTYEDARGNTLWEYRVFLLLPGNQGFSIALSSDKPWVRENPPLLEDILANWRWLL
ncbi:MAG TPA: hypothetical protein DDZ66_11400 [Firmicutes bacterium]|nr:hypothetical protein [Bacillota bacterium]